MCGLSFISSSALSDVPQCHLSVAFNDFDGVDGGRGATCDWVFTQVNMQYGAR